MVLTLIFTRSLMGLFIFGFRFGELVVGFGLFSIFLYIFFNKDDELKKLFSILVGQIILFIVISLINGGVFTATYTYKSSSYIWMIGYFFIGTLFFTHFKFTKLYLFVIAFIPVVIYVFNSGNYPDFIINIFKENGDKFQFIKGSDVLMAFLFCSYLLKRNIENKLLFLFYFNFLGSLLLPLFLTLSRASFFSCAFFLIAENIINFKLVRKNIFKYLGIFMLMIIMFISSSIRLSGLPDRPSEEPAIFVQDSVTEVVERKNTNQFVLLYISDGRVKSKDNTLEWRLDIWQDLTYDLIQKNKLAFGFGFNEIFEVMKDPSAPGRLGREGLNEHVHNHIFTILGRMGIVGLIYYLFFQFNLLKKLTLKTFISYFVPLFLVTMFDTTMESVQFPFLYYLFVASNYVDD